MIARKFQKTGLLIAGTILLLSLVALIIVNRRRAEAEHKAKEIASIGAEWEQSGRMSQADYIKLRHLITEVQSSGGVISPPDLDWSLAMLKSGPDAIARSRVMGMLGLLGERTALPPVYKQKVLRAVEPFLTSADDLDQRYAKRVERALKSR